MADPLHPTAQVLIALGSIIVHYEEWTSDKGDPMDKTTIDSLRNQPDVAQWFKEMEAAMFLPLKR